LIAEFLTHIYGEQTGNVVIGLRDKPGADGVVNRFTWFSYPSEFDKMVSFAEEHKTADLYYSPILYGDKTNDKGKISRTPENALTTQVLYADSDTARPEHFRFEPSIVVETSKDRFHTYWMLNEPVDAKVAAEICHRITTAHADKGSDQNGWSANKVLRIPGSWNTSHGFFPEDVKVAYTGLIYDVLDISGGYEDIETVTRAPMRPEAVDVKQPEDLPDYAEVLDKLSNRTLELALAAPLEIQDRSRLRYKLLLELAREPNVTFEEALSVAWHAPAAEKWSREDPRGISGLIAEAAKAAAEVAYEQGEGITPPEPDEEGKSVDTVVSLLLPHERKQIANIDTWIKRYVRHAGSRVPKQNAPYDRINAWTILSLALSDTGFIPRQSGREALNMYVMCMGDTTTGKSQARKLMFAILREIFAGDEEFDIGGNASASALGRKLMDRDGKVSFFNKDEAHGTLKTWMSQDWTVGMVEDLAELYDGRVPPQLRTGNWEQSGKSATTYFTMHLMGTPKAMIATLNRDMFLTGFLARFQWSIGEPREVTYDSMAEVDSDGEDIKLGFDPMARQYAAEFKKVKSVLRGKAGQDHVAIRINKEAARRIQDAKWQLTQTFSADKNFDILEPSLVRLGVTLRKAASLLAMSEGRAMVELNDVLLALEAMEEWVTNLATVVGQISASDFERACDEVLDFITSKGGSVPREKVIRRFRAIETRFLESYIGSLISQGRLREVNGKDKVKYLETTTGKEVG
jgi:hypothetical protein